MMTAKIPYSILVESIAEEAGISKTAADKFIKEIFEVIKEGVLRDKRVNVSDLGIFKLIWTEMRMGRNPISGEEIEIPAQYRIKFKPNLSLRTFINREYNHLKSIELKEENIENHDIDKEIKKNETIVNYAVTSEKTETSSLNDKNASIEKDSDGKEIENVEPVILAENDDRKHNKSKRSFIIPVVIIIILLIVILMYNFPSEKNIDVSSYEKKSSENISENTTSLENVIPVHTEKNTDDIKNSENKIQEVKKDNNGISNEVLSRYETYKVVENDTFWSIAGSFYNNSYLWPNIYRKNQKNVKNPDDILTGITVNVPKLEGNGNNLSKNDISDMIEGYIKVYFFYKNKDRIRARHYLWVARKIDKINLLKKYKGKINHSDWIFTEKIKGKVHFIKHTSF